MEQIIDARKICDFLSSEEKKETVAPIVNVLDLAKMTNEAKTRGECLVNGESPPFCGDVSDATHVFNPVYEKRLVTEIIHAGVQTQATMIKKKFSAETDLDTYEKKQIIKARHKEMERSQVQDFVLTEDGTPIVETKDVRFDLPSRRFTNLKRPKIITYMCPESEQTCYCLLCMVGDKVRRVYFLESKIGKYAYVSRKCMAAGIYFEYNPVSHMKEMVLKFMAQLISWCEDTVELPYDTGWYYDGDGELCYANEEDLTWKDVLKRAE